MPEFPAAQPHGPLEEVFPNVFVVTGTMRAEFFGATWQFSRNMTVVREGERLTLINSVRLDAAGLARLDELGAVTDVIRLGSMHGYDDAFYVNHYRARLWELPKMPESAGVTPERALTSGAELPIADASLFEFETSKLPEGILRLEREGGILIACDALQNWLEPDRFFSEETAATMQNMGFFTRANLGPAWRQLNEPGAADFERLRRIRFRHALTAHGAPLRHTASADFADTFERLFAG